MPLATEYPQLARLGGIYLDEDYVSVHGGWHAAVRAFLARCDLAQIRAVVAELGWLQTRHPTDVDVVVHLLFPHVRPDRLGLTPRDWVEALSDLVTSTARSP